MQQVHCIDCALLASARSAGSPAIVIQVISAVLGTAAGGADCACCCGCVVYSVSPGARGLGRGAALPSAVTSDTLYRMWVPV